MAQTSPPRARGPYAKTAHVRERIIDACIEVFAESGYRATTMKEIAERSGISERGLTHHFPAKAELLTAALERREERTADRIPRSHGLTSLLSMLDVIVTDSTHPGLVELHSVIAAEATAQDHPAHDHYAHRYDAVRWYATAAFDHLSRSGELQSALSPSDLGAAFVALSDGLQLQWLYDRSSVDPHAILKRFLESLIPAMGSAKSDAP